MKECCQIEDPKKDIKKLKIRFLIVGLALLGSIVGGAMLSKHPLHLSVTEIVQNPRTSALEISIRIFSDDLQTALTKHYAAPQLAIGEANQHTKAGEFLARYANDILKISVNEKSVQPTWVGFETKQDGATWLYLEIPNSQNPKKITVTQKALCGVHPDQQNVVNIRIGNARRSLLLTCDSSTDTAQF